MNNELYCNKNYNGTNEKTIIITELNNILIPFNTEYAFFQPNNIKSILDFYINNINKYNIIIDDRLILAISYLAIYFNDLLIYDTSSNSIITLFQFVNKYIFNNRVRVFDRYKLNNILFTYTFIKYRCNHLLINWKIENCIKSVLKYKTYLPHVFNCEILLDYIETTENDLKIIQNYKPKDIYNSFFVNDDLTQINLKNKNELLMELLNIKKYKSKIVLL